MFSLPDKDQCFTFIDHNKLSFDWNDNDWCSIPSNTKKDVMARIAKMRIHLNLHEVDGCDNFEFTRRRNQTLKHKPTKKITRLPTEDEFSDSSSEESSDQSDSN